jgi:hypothetical protein
MAFLHSRNVFFHLKGRLSKNLVVVFILLDGEDFLVCEEDVLVPVLGLPLEETFCSCPSDRLSKQE